MPITSLLLFYFGHRSMCIFLDLPNTSGYLQFLDFLADFINGVQIV